MPNDIHPGRLHGRMVHHNRRWQESLMAVMEPATDKPNPAEIDVGGRLRELRTAQGLSIRTLAEMSGLNFNTLSLIENSKTSPSVSTLQRLALALNVSITAFFERVRAPKQVVFQKSGQRPRASFAYGLLEDLGDGMTLQGGQPLLVTMKPGADSGPDSIVHTGHELVYCLDGCFTYQVGSEEYLLHTGDSLLFEAHLPHCWKNSSKTISRSLLILCPADENDTSTERHFTTEVEKDEAG